MHRKHASLAAGMLSLMAFTMTLSAAEQDTRPAISRAPGITVSHATTYLLEPLNLDGTVNYVSYVDTQCRRGVMGDNNATLLLLQAFGPTFLGAKKETQSRICAQLNVPIPPHNGSCFVRLSEYARTMPDAFRPLSPATTDSASILDQQLQQATTRPWGENEFPALADWFRKNKIAIDLIEQASRLPKFYVPLVSSYYPPTLTDCLLQYDIRALRESGKLLVARAMIRLKEGNSPAAWQDVMIVYRLARLIQQQPFIMGKVISATTANMADKAAAEIATNGNLSLSQALTMLEKLQALPPAANLAQCEDQEERLFSLDLLTVTARNGNRPPDPKLQLESLGLDWISLLSKIPIDAWDHDETLRMANAWQDQLVAIAQKSTVAERRELYKRSSEEFAKPLREPLSKKTLQTLLNKSFDSPEQRRREFTRAVNALLFEKLFKTDSTPYDVCEAQVMYQQLVEVALALAAYKDANGHFPPALDALSPKYLPQVPLDRLAGQPLKYQPRGGGYLLYSVGRNGLDEDGRGGNFDKDDDIVIEKK